MQAILKRLAGDSSLLFINRAPKRSPAQVTVAVAIGQYY